MKKMKYVSLCVAAFGSPVLASATGPDLPCAHCSRQPTLGLSYQCDKQGTPGAGESGDGQNCTTTPLRKGLDGHYYNDCTVGKACSPMSSQVGKTIYYAASSEASCPGGMRTAYALAYARNGKVSRVTRA